MPDDNNFLSSAGRHQRKQTPVKKPFSFQTLLIVFALILIATSFFIGDGEQPEEVSGLEIKKPALNDSAAKNSVIANTTTTGLPASLENLLDGEQARSLIKTTLGKGQQSPADIFSQAEKLRKTGKYTDAWLLHFYAARQGHAPSSASLAFMSDPGTYQKFGSPLANGDEFQALKWYSLATKQGDTKSADNFNQFKKHLQNKANSGDTHSRQLLLQLDSL